MTFFLLDVQMRLDEGTNKKYMLYNFDKVKDKISLGEFVLAVTD